MQEIRCPKCGEVFQVDETGYDQIAQQVRDKEFEKELERRKSELNAKHVWSCGGNLSVCKGTMAG